MLFHVQIFPAEVLNFKNSLLWFHIVKTLSLIRDSMFCLMALMRWTIGSLIKQIWSRFQSSIKVSGQFHSSTFHTFSSNAHSDVTAINSFSLVKVFVYIFSGSCELERYVVCEELAQVLVQQSISWATSTKQLYRDKKNNSNWNYTQQLKGDCRTRNTVKFSDIMMKCGLSFLLFFITILKVRINIEML